MAKPSKLLLYQGLFYFLLLPFITFLLSDFILPSSGITAVFYQTPPMSSILLLGLVGIPSSLTSLIASSIAIQTKKNHKPVPPLLANTAPYLARFLIAY